MAKPYSEDLRKRVVAAVDGGLSRHQAAALFDVGVSTVVHWVRRSLPRGCGVVIDGPLAAIATRPDLIVLDEPVSSLDVSIRAQILNLLMDLQDETGVAYLFISHDLAVVRAVARRVAVMDAGRIVESGDPAQVFAAPQAQATLALVRAVPQLRAAV